MTEQIVLTHSDVMSFLRCRRAFKWSVVEDWTKPESSVGALALGTRVHNAAEQFHRTGEDPVYVHARLATEARTRNEDAPDWLRDKLEDDIVVGTNCVMAYRNWVRDEDPYAGWERVGIEETISTELLNGRVLLQGKIDVLLRNDAGMYKIEDLKTVGNARIDAALNNVTRSFQHLWYAYVLEREGKSVLGARYIHLKKVKVLSRTTDPVIVSDVPALRRSVRTAVAYIEQIVTEIVALIDANEETGWYPYPQDSCAWCDYRTPCMLAYEGRGTETDHLKDKFLHNVRLARYIQPPEMTA